MKLTIRPGEDDYGRPVLHYLFEETGKPQRAYSRPIHTMELFEDTIMALLEKALGLRVMGDPDPWLLVTEALPAKFREGRYQQILDKLEKEIHQNLLEDIMTMDLLRGGS